MISDATAVVDTDNSERLFHGGNAVPTVKSADEKNGFTLRAASCATVGSTSSAAVEKITIPSDSLVSKSVEDKVAASHRPALASAGIVVSGGCGVGSLADSALIEKLADKSGADVGASRAAVDSGYVPNDWQVGQTRKVVAPTLNVAEGILGAIEQLAGMRGSNVIAAINKEEETPFFQVANYGLVADLFTAIPDLTSKL